MYADRVYSIYFTYVHLLINIQNFLYVNTNVFVKVKWVFAVCKDSYVIIACGFLTESESDRGFQTVLFYE